MKIYNVAGWALVLAYALACMYFAPPDIGPWTGLAVGAAYFVVCWLIGGVYLSCVIHMGIAHRALDYKDWFVKTITVVNNTFGVYVNPGHLGQPAPAAPQVFRSSGRSQQARCRRLLADAVPLPDALRARGRHGRRRDLQVLVVPARIEPGVRCSRTGVQLLPAVAGRRRRALRSGDLDHVPDLRVCGSTWSRTTGRTIGVGATGVTTTNTTTR